MDGVSFKENIKKYYDQEAELRNSKSVKADWKIKVRENFCDLIKRENKKTLLEIGAGAGYDSQFFMSSGLSVTAIDLSVEMIKKCRAKDIEAYELDYYNLTSLNRKFDSIYAINTLLHVPKNDLRHVLNEINMVLDTDGLFYMGLYGGEDTESELIISEVSAAPRLFSFYSREYLESILDEYFRILYFDIVSVDDGIFHSITMQKL